MLRRSLRGAASRPQRPARAWRYVIGAALASPAVLAPAQLPAKTPGHTYCFVGTCHRVKTIEETRALVGKTMTMHASFYDDAGKDSYNPSNLTSSGEYFRSGTPDNAASPVLPDGTKLLVWHPGTRKAVIVRVNNAGPYWGRRLIDLSRAAADRLGFRHSGVSTVHVKVLEAPTRSEATYRRGRRYEPVPGYIGAFASIDDALSDAGRRLAKNFGPAPSVLLASAAAKADPLYARLGPVTDTAEHETGQALVMAAAELSPPAEMIEETTVAAAAMLVATLPPAAAAAAGEQTLPAIPSAKPDPAPREAGEPAAAPATASPATPAPVAVAAVVKTPVELPGSAQSAAKPKPAKPPVVVASLEPKAARPARGGAKREPVKANVEKSAQPAEKPVEVAAKPDAKPVLKPTIVASKEDGDAGEAPQTSGRKGARMIQTAAKPVQQPRPVKLPLDEHQMELDRRVWFRTALSIN